MSALSCEDKKTEIYTQPVIELQQDSDNILRHLNKEQLYELIREQSKDPDEPVKIDVKLTKEELEMKRSTPEKCITCTAWLSNDDPNLR